MNALRQNKLTLITIIFILVSYISCSRPDNNTNKIIEKKAIENLKSEDWNVRKKGVFSLIDINKNMSSDTELELSNLMKKETDQFKNYKKHLENKNKTSSYIDNELYKKYPPGEYDDYITALTRLISKKKNKEDLPDLFELIANTNFTLSPTILATYGVDGLDFFIEKVQNGTSKEKQLSLNVLSVLTSSPTNPNNVESDNTPTLKSDEREKIKGILLQAAVNDNYNVRFTAINGLENFITDKDVRSLLLKAANTDNEQFIRQIADEILKRNN